MGSGKSTLGKKLAGLLRRPFIDLDKYIEANENSSIAGIFEKEGEAAFRQKETHYLEEILKIQIPHVIALGGGTVCFGDNLQHIRQHGFLIYVELPPAALAERIRNSRQQRPLLKQVPAGDLQETIRKKLEERLPFYTQAHLTVDGISLTAPLLQHAILEATKK